MYEDCFTPADASTNPTKIEGSPRGRLNMEDELLSWHIPMTKRALGVGADGHSTNPSVGKGLNAAEMYTGIAVLEVTGRSRAGFWVSVAETTFRVCRYVSELSILSTGEIFPCVSCLLTP